MAGEYQLRQVDINGRTSSVENLPSDVRLGLPSPDNRNLAIMAMTENQNIWMMETSDVAESLARLEVHRTVSGQDEITYAVHL